MISILLFAQLQEEAGCSEVEIEADAVSIADIKTLLQTKYGIGSLLESCFVAVNEEYVEDTVVVKNGDTVAFLPPVSGG
ncbi:molybdopterin converting factor subunit 1 [Fictibacillus macauensis ZFHKF-1]|uniref:Molybdopterin synthase sulfur carrier subunit n=1 Tax=Fictibacillus macauensis ZFHKF-1 TaxID=1196324 RepID=I8UCD9_9BACL|nr:molybdopterin converting factor subunit 1 [Fictibacillus macauensis]EIT84575.1 molybdopterin converting factor subunit 1 [Fictibacillus macauensis ZFHKF-1]